jgi:hypothetical protein
MNRKTLISLAAAAALSIGFAASAQAKPHINFGVHFGSGAPTFDLGVSDGGYYPGYGYPGYYDAGYGDDDGSDCGWQIVSHSHWNYNHTFKITTHKKQWVCG